MSQGHYKRRGSNVPREVTIHGRFTVSGGTCTVVTGRGYTPTESDTGEYTITLDRAYANCVVAHATVFGTATTGETYQVEPSSFGTQAIVFKTRKVQYDGSEASTAFATAVDTNLTNSDGLCFTIVMQDSDIPVK